MATAATKTKSELTLPPWKPIAGVQTLLVEKHDIPMVQFSIAFPAGAYSEPSAKGGLANFTSEMLLRGTKTKSREEIETELDHLGATLEVESGYHSLQLDGQVLRKNFDRLLELTLEILSSPSFPEMEVKKLKDELIAQLHMRLEEDASLARTFMHEALYSNHPYGRDVLGKVATLNAITRSDVEQFYKTNIHRGGLMIAAAGDLDTPSFEKMVQSIVSKLPSGETNVKSEPFRSALKGRHVVLIDKPERTQTQFFIAQPGVNATDPDYLPLRVFLMAFGGGMFQAQYMQEIRVKRGWAYGASASVDARRDGGLTMLYTYPAVKDTLPALKLSLELLENAVNGNGLTDAQIEFARTNLSRAFPFIVDTPDKVMTEKIYDRFLGHPDNYLDTYVDQMKKVTVAQARAVAKKRLNTKNLEIVILCTAKDFREKIGKELHADSVDVIPYDRM